MSKFYVVWKGRKTGIFSRWDECAAQVKGYRAAQYIAFDSQIQAERAFLGQYTEYAGQRLPAVTAPGRPLDTTEPIRDSYAVDASCLGNPGRLEYRCIHTSARQLVFQQGPFEGGTNNVGEFLAIVHALALLTTRAITAPIYSDSQIALAWVQEKQCRTGLQPTENNAYLFDLITRAEHWLQANDCANKLLKWQTKAWGEIPADYGRKQRCKF